ncbi:MAG TPA: CpaD family pilus assembly lipoprotein [Magnetospirillaceae bacterium]|nr:CpaD family pilus assembly lipoprotein [Magnetospirillaceae bacterium]
MSFSKNIAISLFGALLLSGCADLAEQDYRLSHPIGVEQRTLHAVIERGAAGLTATDQERLRAVALEAQRRAAGGITVASGDPALARQIADQLRIFGIGAITLAESGDANRATVDLPIWEAMAPQCGDFDGGFNPDYGNAPNSNWGCALQRNRALMVQNPADLVRAQPATGRDGNRAVDTLDKYGRGLATGAAPEIPANRTSTPSSNP